MLILPSGGHAAHGEVYALALRQAQGKPNSVSGIPPEAAPIIPYPGFKV
jgi:hypothetical protein